MEINTIFATVFVLITFVGASVLHLCLAKNKKTLRIVCGILCGLYLVAVFVFTMAKVSIADVVKVEFVSNGKWFAKTFNFDLSHITKTDFLINIFLMYPIGQTGTLLFKSKNFFAKVAMGLLAGFVLGLTVEVLQFCLPVFRGPSLSDILLNSLSGLIGGLICAVIEKIIQHSNNQKNNF